VEVPAEPQVEVKPEPEVKTEPEESVPLVSEPLPYVDPVYGASLTVLQEMGFTDTDGNLAALMECDGDLSAVITRLLAF